MLRRALILARMRRNEARSAAALAAHQRRVLQGLVHHAQSRVPFYRDLYAGRGVRAPAIRELADLQSLPLIDKGMLRAAGAGAVSLDAPADTVSIYTSGSSGEPYRFPIDRRYDQWRKAQYLRPYLSSGRRLRDKVLRLTGQPQRRTPWFTQLGLLREWRLHCADEPAHIVDAWRRLAPDVLQGYPSALRALAHHCLDNPLTPAPRLVFTDSELLLSDTRVLLERAFGAPVFDIFGTFETDNIAYQCARREGYHIAADSVILEIVRDGKVVPAGESGEIVVTVLMNRTSPFIRYNLGDIGRLSAQPCPCGLALPLLAVVEGRANELLTLPDGRHCTPQGIFSRLNNFAGTIRQYQLRQTRSGAFELFIVPARPLSGADLAAIVAAMRSTLAGSVIEPRVVEHIPPDPSGKRRLFIPAPRALS
ncbi:MAG TPA: hypothetical protein VIX87_04025 [Steroidobacteraceae bacterium]